MAYASEDYTNLGAGTLMLFHTIEDKQAVLRNTKSGVFKQVKLYQRGGEVYAGCSGGFIRLMHEGKTSSPNTIWDDIEIEYNAPNRVSGGIRLKG